MSGIQAGDGQTNGGTRPRRQHRGRIGLLESDPPSVRVRDRTYSAAATARVFFPRRKTANLPCSRSSVASAWSSAVTLTLFT